MSTLVDDRVGELERENAELRRLLAERTAERDEALEQQTATAEVLQVINSSPGDLKPVFDAILEKAMSLCEAALGFMTVYDGNRFTPAAMRDVPEALAAYFAAGMDQPRPGEAHWRLLEGEDLVHNLDQKNEEAYRVGTPLRRAAVDLGGTRTALVVALRKDRVLRGTMTLYRKEVRPFTDKQIALLQNFAAQAVIAMENARLLTETREALEQQTATAEVLQVINASPGNLAPVFDAMLERALASCGASYGGLLTFDGERFHPMASRGHAEFDAWHRQHGPIRPTPGSQIARIISGEDAVQITDIANDDVYRRGSPPRRAMVDIGGFQTLLCVALRKDTTLLGVLQIYRQEVRPFTDKQIALLQNFAAQAVIAMENARLITETREALEQQTATAEVLQVINSSPGDLAPVFEAILEKAHNLCGSDFGGLLVYDGEHLQAAAFHNVPPSFAELARRPFRPGPKNRLTNLIQGENLVHVDDLRDVLAEAPDDPMVRAAVELAGIRTILVVALRKDDVLLGVITAYRQEVRPFSDQQIALLQNFAAQAVIAMENARLLTETREALEQQTATAEVLQVINASPGDLAPVFDTVLERALRLCEGVHGNLSTYDGEYFHRAASLGAPAAFTEFIDSLGPIRPAPGTTMGRFVEGEDMAHILDVAAEDAYRQGAPVRKAIVELSGCRTLVAVALRKDGRLLGQITVYRQEVRPFTDKQIALLQNFAAQAVIAMENARLITETREALEQQTATAEVLQVINASPGDLAPVFDAMLEKAVRLCGFDFASLWTYDGTAFQPVAKYQIPEAIWVYMQQHTPPSFVRLAGGERFVRIADLRQDAAYQSDFTRDLRRLGLDMVRSLLIVPLRKNDALLGLIVAYSQEVQPFSNKQITVLENFAAQAVIAMENARLLGELRARTDEIAAWNRELEERVAAQVAELERVGKLKRFLAPQLAELIVARGDEDILETHRRDIVVVFCDLRGFTAFAETAEPEEVLDLLREYHGALGPVVAASEGTLDHFSGDGIMVFFNDPVPVPDASERAVQMAIEMRQAMALLQARWRRQGREIGFGVGIARGYATLGQIGFADRIDYTAIGTVCNLAARLCAEARDGQILISRRVAAAVEDTVRLEEIGDLALKGLMQAVAVYNVAAE